MRYLWVEVGGKSEHPCNAKQQDVGVISKCDICGWKLEGNLSILVTPGSRMLESSANEISVGGSWREI